MTNERRSEDGFDGRYPKQLDWNKIIAELTAEAKEGGEDVASDHDD